MIAFSIPSIPSFTSTTPNKLPILFVPNVKYLLKFVEGDLGISDKLMKTFMSAQLTQIKTPEDLSIFLEATGVDLGPNPEQFFNGEKFKPPASIKLGDQSGNLGGLKAFEKALIQSIFETQKPYFEIAKLVVDNLVFIEDIVAHVLSFGGLSKKPKGNPRALGYQGQQEGGGAGAGMNALGKIGKKKGPKNTASSDSFNPERESPQSEAKVDPSTGNYIAITISTIYSTGKFDPNVDYDYQYIDYFEEFNPPIESDSTELEEEDDTGKKEAIVLGVYDQNYDPLFYNEVNERLPWLIDKYIGGGPWPQLKPEDAFDYIYVKKLYGIPLAYNVGSPGELTELESLAGVQWEILRYKEGQGPTIDIQGTNKSIKKDQLAVAYNTEKTQSTFRFYRDFYLEYTDKQLKKALGNTPSTYTDEDGSIKDVRVETLKDMSEKLNDFGPLGMIPAQVEGLISNNFMSISKNNTIGLANIESFSKLTYAFKPKKINDIWYDPESDYDIKILKCDITDDITFSETIGEREKKAKLLRFVKKTFNIKVSNGKKINYILRSPEGAFFIRDQSSITIDYFIGQQNTPQSGQRLINILEDYTNAQGILTPLGNFRLGPTDFPIQIVISEITPNLTSFWNYDTNKRAYFKVVPGSTQRPLLVLETKSSNNVWSSEPLTYLEYAPFNKQDLNVNFEPTPFPTPDLSIVKFNGTKVLISSSGRFYGILKDTNFTQFLPNNGQINTVNYDTDTNQITLISQEVKPNLIRIFDLDNGQRIPKIVTGLGNQANITNQQLKVEGPLGKEPYGTPLTSEEPGESRKQTVEKILRYPRTEDDIQTYYIIEAVLKTKNKNQIVTPNEESEIKAKGGSGRKGGGGGSYICCNIDAIPFCIVAIIRKFVRLVIKIATKLIPAIQQFINLIKNPASFVTDIIIAKLGDDFGAEIPKFGFFSKDFLEQLKKAKKYATDLKESKNDLSKLEEIKEEMQAFLDTSLLKNYVHISDQGLGRFMLDGSATIKLFGDAPLLAKLPKITFGIETNLGSLISPEPKVPFKLIFGFDRVRSSSDKALSDFLGVDSRNIGDLIKNSALFNTLSEPEIKVKNQIITDSAGNKYVEEISTYYSTGVFKEDVLYEYVDLSEEVFRLVKEADDLEKKGDAESIAQGINKLQDALKIDPNNEYVRGKIGDLKTKTSEFHTNPIIDFILNLVCLPLKVIIGIVKYIMDFFKKLANPFSLPGEIIRFVSHQWLLDFFNPTSENSMFAMAGILFDIKKLFTVWLPNIKLPEPPSLDGIDVPIPGLLQKFDMNEIIKLPWVDFPVFTREQFKSMLFGALIPLDFPVLFPLEILNVILCYVEGIINSFIDLIWSILGMVDPATGKWVVLKPPYIKLCNNFNRKLTPIDVVKLLNTNPASMNSATENETEGLALNPSLNDVEPSFNFIYDIKTSDGRSVLDLNQVELQKWMDDNKELEYTFNFDGEL